MVRAITRWTASAGALAALACSAAGAGPSGGVNATGGGAGTAGSSADGAAATSGTGGVGGAGGAGGTGALGLGGTPDAGNPLVDGGECEALSQQAENTVRPVDIIWAVDGSPSMSAAAGQVATRMNDMVVSVNNAGIDVHVVIIASAGKVCVQPPFGGAGCSSNPPGYQYVTACPTDCWIGSHNALHRLTGAYPHYKQTIRQNSVKYFGVVTDDSADDTSNYAGAAQGFTDRVAALDPGWFDVWKFFGIFRLPLGTAYKMLVDQTGGTWTEFKFTGTDYNAVFQDLARTVTDSVELDCEWEIPPAPPGETFDSGLVNVDYTSGGGQQTKLKKVGANAAECAASPDGGWYYDDDLAPTKIHVCPQNCATMKADLQGRVDILFGCETQVIVK